MRGRLEGRRAIVTGAASGIGRASAILFAREGAKVVAADVAEPGLAETVKQIEASGGVARAQPTDVSDEDAVRSLVESCAGEFGGLEVFYANAGIGGIPRPLPEQNIATASVAGLRSGAGGAAYSASKAGIVNGQAIAVDGGLSSSHPITLPRRSPQP